MADLSDDSGELLKRLIEEWFRRKLRELSHAAKERGGAALGLGNCAQLLRTWSKSCPEDPYCVIGEKIGGSSLRKAKAALKEEGIDFKVAHALGKEYLCVHHSDLRAAALAVERAGVVMKDVLDRNIHTTQCASRAEATDLAMRLTGRPGAAFDAEVGENENGPVVVVRCPPEREAELAAALLDWDRDLGRDPETKAKLAEMGKNGHDTRRVGNLAALKETVPLTEQAKDTARWREMPVMQWVIDRARKAGVDDKTLAQLSLGTNGEAYDAGSAAQIAKEQGKDAPAQEKGKAQPEPEKGHGKAQEGPGQGREQSDGGRAPGADTREGVPHEPKHMADDGRAAQTQPTEGQRGPSAQTEAREPNKEPLGAQNIAGGREATGMDARGPATHEVPANFDKTVDGLKETAKESYTRIPRSEPKSSFRQAPATEGQISALAAAVRAGDVSMDEFNTLTADGTTLPDRGTVTDLLEERHRGPKTDVGYRGASAGREPADEMISRAEGAARADNAQRAKEAEPSRERPTEGPSKDER